MALEELKVCAKDIQENSKAYLDSSIGYYKLLGFKVFMKSTTLILKLLLISICLLLVLLFISIAGSLSLGAFLHSYPLGFLIVAGFYLVLAFLLFFMKDKIVEEPILKRFSEIFFND